MNAIIYDIEILRAVPSQYSYCEKGIKYCSGWSDHARMGISVIGVYDYLEDRARVFTDDNKGEFAELVKRAPLCVGFNSIPFDNAVIAATNGWAMPEESICYDLLREIWAAAGLAPEFAKKTHGGYGLDAVCEKNFGAKKSGNGALAPVLWQKGQIGEVIDYCLNDVRLTKKLFDLVIAGAPVISPKDDSTLTLRSPFQTVAVPLSAVA